MQNIENAIEIREISKTKTLLYTYRWIYQNIRGNTSQITIMVTHIKKKNQAKCNTKNSQQITRQKKGRKKIQNSNLKKIK